MILTSSENNLFRSCVVSVESNGGIDRIIDLGRGEYRPTVVLIAEAIILICKLGSYECYVKISEREILILVTCFLLHVKGNRYSLFTYCSISYRCRTCGKNVSASKAIGCCAKHFGQSSCKKPLSTLLDLRETCCSAISVVEINVDHVRETFTCGTECLCSRDVGSCELIFERKLSYVGNLQLFESRKAWLPLVVVEDLVIGVGLKRYPFRGAGLCIRCLVKKVNLKISRHNSVSRGRYAVREPRIGRSEQH